MNAYAYRLKVSRNEGGLKVAGKEIPCMRGLIKVNDARAMRTTLRFAVPGRKALLLFHACHSFRLVIITCRIENLCSLHFNNDKQKTFHNVCNLK